MDPTLIVMAVRAAVRLGRAGQQAFGQYARDRDAMLPFVEATKFPQRAIIVGFFTSHQALIGPQLLPYWQSLTGAGGAPRLAGDFDVVSAEYVRIKTADDAKVKPLADEATGLWMVSQWGKGDEPPGPIARVVLTIVDVAAEFAAHDPKLFGVDGNAEVLVKALATRVADLVPDDANAFGPRNQLGERLAGIFLKAGLGALSEHPEAIVEEEHLQSLVKSTLPKLVDSLPQGLDKQVQWRNVVETLLGPVAGEALRSVASSPGAFFGSRFGGDDLLGTLTRTFLLKTADVGLEEIVTKAGAVQLYKAIVQLAAAQPELFVGQADKASERFITAVFRDIATTLESTSPPLDHHLVAELAAATIDTVAREGGTLLKPGEPWHDVLSRTLQQVLSGVAGVLRSGDSGGFHRLGSRESIEGIVRIVVAQIARTPGMVTSSDHAELDRLVSAVATAMAADDDLLLTRDDWLAVLAGAAEEVAANPGRLVGVLGQGAAGSLLETVVGDLLAAAREQWRTHGRSGGTVLFGATLREAVLVAVRAAASQSAAAILNSAKLKELAARITELIVAKAGKYGSKEWLALYRAFITHVIETGVVPPLDEAAADAALDVVGGRT